MAQEWLVIGGKAMVDGSGALNAATKVVGEAIKAGNPYAIGAGIAVACVLVGVQITFQVHTQCYGNGEQGPETR